MNANVSGTTRPSLDRSRAFWLRLVDNLFRYPIRWLLPILLLIALGALSATQSGPAYQSQGVLSAASNPLVSDSEIRGTSILAWESPAAGTSRIINEQIGTAAFTAGIVERAGLSNALSDGLITLDTVRANVWAAPEGNSLLTINAQWSDPASAYQLVTAAIDSYYDLLSETVASDSSEAVQYYTELRDDSQDDLDQAQAQLTTFLAGLPPVPDDEEQPIEVVIQVDSLTDRIARAEEQIATAQANIDAARLTVLQSQSEAGRGLIIIDAPVLPTAPESNLRDTIQTMGIYVLLGGALSALLLLATTMLDRSVSSQADLSAIAGVQLTAVVPPIDRPGLAHRFRSRLTRPGKGLDSSGHETSATDASEAESRARVDESVPA